MYQFLDNYHKRMEQVAIHHYLNEISSIRDELRKMEFSRQQILGLIIQLLCFIMEKSLLEQSCTMKDMETYVEYLMKKQGFLESDMDYGNLVNHLVKTSLQNNGRPYYFSYYNFKEEKEENLHIRLIEDSIIQVDGADSFSYNLTAQGFQFLFSTLEVEEALQMSFEQLKLKYAIQKRNFGSARESVDNLFTLNRKQIQKISEYIVQIKEDIGLFTTENYENTYRTTFDTLSEQNEKHEELYKLITMTKNQYMEQNMDEGTSDMEDDLKNMDYIRSRLQQLLGEQRKLFKEQQTLGDVYNEAIGNVLYIGFENRLNMEKDIVEAFEENVLSLDGMANILRPLMMPDLKRNFNFARAYSPQRIESYEDVTTEDNIYLDETTDEEEEKLYIERIDYVQGTYDEMILRILDGILVSEDGGARLSELFDTVEDVELLRNVLVQLHGDHRISIAKMLKQSREHMHMPGEDFDFGYSLGRIGEKGMEIMKLGIVEIEAIEGSSVMIVNHRDKKYLKCSDILFRRKEDGNG